VVIPAGNRDKGIAGNRRVLCLLGLSHVTQNGPEACWSKVGWAADETRVWSWAYRTSIVKVGLSSMAASRN
jgi:hypothetical protein